MLADRSGAEQNKASLADEHSKCNATQRNATQRSAAQSKQAREGGMYIEQSRSASVHRQRKKLKLKFSGQRREEHVYCYCNETFGSVLDAVVCIVVSVSFQCSPFPP